MRACIFYFFFFQAEDGIRDLTVTGVQTCALPIYPANRNQLTDVLDRSFADNTSSWELGSDGDRKSTRLNSSHSQISYAVFCLKPKLMTSFAFILGCVPLWTASGAGSVARPSMGTTVIGGVLAASVIGIFFLPAVFYLVEKFLGAGQKQVLGALPATTPPVVGY